MWLRFCASGLLILIFVSSAGPRDVPQSPGPISAVLMQMIDRARKLQQANPDLRNDADTIVKGAVWLDKALREDDPADYRLQLTIDNYLLGVALEAPSKAATTTKRIASDLDLKGRDCHQFGHGRRVTVEVKTLRGTTEESGWQICYRWVPTEDLPVIEMHFPGLSSPSRCDLPVGLYQVHAEKKDSSGNLQKSDAVPITVGMESAGPWQLQLP